MASSCICQPADSFVSYSNFLQSFTCFTFNLLSICNNLFYINHVLSLLHIHPRTLLKVSMASKALAVTALLLTLNLLFFSFVTSTKCPPTTPKPPKTPKSPKKEPAVKPTCPTDTLKLGVCADLLGLVNVVVGSPPKTPCCTLLQGLANLEAAVCLCTALKANVLGINLNVPIDLSLLLNYCGKKLPYGFQCA